MKTWSNSYGNMSKPFNWGTGTVIEINGEFKEFPTEEEAWEFYNERRSSNG